MKVLKEIPLPLVSFNVRETQRQFNMRTANEIIPSCDTAISVHVYLVCRTSEYPSRRQVFG